MVPHIDLNRLDEKEKNTVGLESGESWIKLETDEFEVLL